MGINYKTKFFIGRLLSLLFIPFLVMCGSSKSGNVQEVGDGKVPIKVSVSKQKATDGLNVIGFSLADEDSTSYSITIVCDSDIDTAGGSADELIVTQATTNLRLYVKDQCTSTLTTVVIDGVTYSGTSSTTQGNTATLTDGGSNSIRVTSSDILDGSEIASGDAILYEYEAFDAESDQTLSQNDVENSDSTSHTVEGIHAPRYTIAAGAGVGIQLSDITANGAATLTINLVCGASFVEDTSCDGQAIDQLDYWLVDASDSDGAGGSGIDFSDGVTYTELETLSTGTAGIDLKTDVTSAMDSTDVDSVTGGTQSGLSLSVDGPYAMFEHLDLIFVLKFVDSADGNSYLFFDIDINDLTSG